MGILGIENRTENWKTARHFAPFFKSASARAALANRLLRPYEESESDAVKAVKMELYWKGMRDYIHELDKNKKPTTQDFQKRYVCLFLTCVTVFANSIFKNSMTYGSRSHAITMCLQKAECRAYATTSEILK